MNQPSERESLDLEFPADVDPLVGLWLATFADCRGRTLSVIERIPDGSLETDHPLTGNSIGTLLYHIAQIEADWLFVEVLEREFPEELVERFIFEVRDENGRLTPVHGIGLASLLELLAMVREYLVATYATLDADELHRARHLEQYDVTPSWVASHLIQHESEHRAELSMVIDWLERGSPEI